MFFSISKYAAVCIGLFLSQSALADTGVIPHRGSRVHGYEGQAGCNARNLTCTDAALPSSGSSRISAPPS